MRANPLGRTGLCMRWPCGAFEGRQTEVDMKIDRIVSLAASFCAGAAVMYVLDPERGHRRRAIARDKALHWGRVAARRGRNNAFDMGNRIRGAVAEARGRIFRRQVGDDVLVARVASKLGRLVDHPHPVGVTAEAGIISLSGYV